MKNLGKVSALFLILFFSLSFGQEAKEDSVRVEKINASLKNDDWKVRDATIAELRKDINKYKKNENINQLLFDLLKKEISLQKERSNKSDSLNSNFSIEKDSGYGDYIINLTDLAIQYDHPNLFELIIEFPAGGKVIREAVLNVLLTEKRDSLGYFNMIKNRYFSDEKFYIHKKSSYILVLNEYLNRKKNGMEANKKQIIKEVLIDALTNDIDKPKNKFLLKSAKEGAEYFKDDEEIQKALEKLRE